MIATSLLLAVHLLSAQAGLAQDHGQQQNDTPFELDAYLARNILAPSSRHDRALLIRVSGDNVKDLTVTAEVVGSDPGSAPADASAEAPAEAPADDSADAPADTPATAPAKAPVKCEDTGASSPGKLVHLYTVENATGATSQSLKIDSKGKDSKGTAVFGIETCKLAEGKVQESFQIKVSVNSKTGAHREYIVPGTVATGFATTFMSERVSSEVFLGTSLGRAYDDDGKST